MNAFLRIPSHIRAMIDNEGAVLLDLEAGKYYSLNEVGVEIWNHVEQGRSREEILRHLRDAYCIPAERLETELSEFVSSLQQKGLIHVGQ